MRFKTLEEAMEFYGKDNVIALLNLRQILSYAAWGVQPIFICESEFDKKLVAYYYQPDTDEAWSRWRSAKPTK